MAQALYTLTFFVFSTSRMRIPVSGRGSGHMCWECSIDVHVIANLYNIIIVLAAEIFIKEESGGTISPSKLEEFYFVLFSLLRFWGLRRVAERRMAAETKFIIKDQRWSLSGMTALVTGGTKGIRLVCYVIPILTSSLVVKSIKFIKNFTKIYFILFDIYSHPNIYLSIMISLNTTF